MALFEASHVTKSDIDHVVDTSDERLTELEQGL